MDGKQPQKAQKGGYGKRPLWQWVVLYVIVGAIVYGLIYYIIIAMNNNGGSGNGAPLY